jgi:DNA-binding transcriptional regulator GbsR (MarR family)
MSTVPKPVSAPTAPEQLVVAYFCRLADTVGLPRTVALIYATLFLAEEPLSFSEIVERAGLSKASASTGIRLLQRMGGVHVVVRPAERRTYYRAETSMRRLLAGFLSQTLQPGLADSARILESAARNADDDPRCPEHLTDRIASLRRWHEIASELLPNLSALGSG